jgi:hypothetical protein
VDKGLLSGTKRTSLHKTANKHFGNFLRFTNSVFGSLDDIPEEEFTKDFLGRFSDYLSKKVHSITKYNTHDNYLSAVYVQLCEKYPQKKLIYADYYKRLRDNVFIPLNDHAIFNSIPMVPMRILDMLGCVLLLWHEDVSARFPEHRLVVRINSLQSSTKLKEWQDCITHS